MKCSLEEGVRAIASAGATRCGDESVNGGVCSLKCKERIRACVLAATATRAAFYAIWSNNYEDGVGTRRAVVGRVLDDGTYELRWFTYEFSSGYDGRTETRYAPARERWTSNTCEQILDLHDIVCPNQDATPAATLGCRMSRAEREDDLELGCREPRNVATCEDSR
jgi:hypothetical protein